jgi:hypothetical protein
VGNQVRDVVLSTILFTMKVTIWVLVGIALSSLIWVW